ncbi:hypothetical protein Cni_G14877 [Canna indica]|uniref:Mitochondrial import inner membrane translocase subunit n=1 Tax=Canna indica TaxID=4628 RepID=A0AAQ3KCS9_9LILI|nr:hypothetical protein Cni_G14877 [Canna indica]
MFVAAPQAHSATRVHNGWYIYIKPRARVLLRGDSEEGGIYLSQNPAAISLQLRMDSFSSPLSASSGQSGPSAEVLMDQLKDQLAQAYAEEFFETVRSKCFAKCITKPGTSLSGSESSCISRCVDRYIEATGIVGRALFNSPR